jgi:short-subunit dehydrogenase
MKVLKGCNCCLSSRRAIKLMGLRARISRCTTCKAKTVWSDLSDAEAEAYRAERAKREAFMASLMEEVL